MRARADAGLRQRAHSGVLDLRPGETVRVRSAGEIFSTLDEHGSLDGLPFMPEMVKYCGRSFQVFKRADKTCDASMRMRRMEHAVHLTNVRCDGSAHDGCQAACLMYWDEAWLERAERTNPNHTRLDTREEHYVSTSLMPATTASTRPVGTERMFRCQATDIEHASTVVSAWQLDQYPRDVRNWGLRKLVVSLAVALFNQFQRINRKFLPRITLFGGGRAYPFLTGALPKESAPSAKLNVRPGDLVRIKSKDEILKTLDDTNHNHGLSFDVEMLRYCGRTARVRDRVERLIDEHTGKMIHIRSDCVILEGIVCTGNYHRLCTRSTFPFWREIWLERLP